MSTPNPQPTDFALPQPTHPALLRTGPDLAADTTCLHCGKSWGQILLYSDTRRRREFGSMTGWTGYPLHHVCADKWLREHELYDDHSKGNWGANRPKMNNVVSLITPDMAIANIEEETGLDHEHAKWLYRFRNGICIEDHQRIFSETFEQKLAAATADRLLGGGNGRAARQSEQPSYDDSALTLDAWLTRELADQDCLLGSWLTTTSRVICTAPTGLGKTMFALGLALSASAGTTFLHWQGVRPAKVLFIDGEMSRRLLKTRLAQEVERSGLRPDGMHVLSHEDVENFAPLNTPEGQWLIEKVITQIGGVDLIVFDNVMSLIGGDQKDEEGWRQTLPWVHSLTRRSIGQFWIHHTGHDESRSYGTKTREWQMDSVIHLETVERSGADVSFQLTFRKARERTPDTRADFVDVRIALVGDQWTVEGASTKRKVSPLAKKFFGALRDATISDPPNKMFGCPAASIEDWRAECIGRGLIEKGKDHSARTLFHKYRRELIVADWIACNETMAWIL